MAFISPLPLSLSASSGRATLSTSAPCMSAAPSSSPLSRRALLSAAGLAAASAALASAAPPARAGLLDSFSRAIYPKRGFNAPGTVAPGTVALDRSVLTSAEGKAAVASLRAFGDAVKTAGRDFEAAPGTFDIAAALKGVKVDQLRGVLNVVDEAFDEETQKTTDKVVRGIIQDLGELIYNGAVKGGVERTDMKVERIRAWLKKIDGDFDFLLGFCN